MNDGIESRLAFCLWMFVSICFNFMELGWHTEPDNFMTFDERGSSRRLAL